jgi:hypothetical protein
MVVINPEDVDQGIQEYVANLKELYSLNCATDIFYDLVAEHGDIFQELINRRSLSDLDARNVRGAQIAVGNMVEHVQFNVTSLLDLELQLYEKERSLVVYKPEVIVTSLKVIIFCKIQEQIIGVSALSKSYHLFLS